MMSIDYIILIWLLYARNPVHDCTMNWVSLQAEGATVSIGSPLYL